ncbi:GrpB protein-domain-containing protein [Lophiotrema nucula]|uniref:GrpB protein-domain-containing protein n=1 Tax=Lophiotrema nucula TaxID=690887 RepID=A0A6A5YJA7_9PLEO|nr:GrpB protein-domain-containing protein [Lophiotrema nucula]
MSVVVEQYNPAWPEHFQAIKSELEGFLKDANVVSIEHVGSTSVPGLAAKPIIDVDIITARENVQEVVDALVSNGNFAYFGELGIVDRHALRDPNQSPPRNIYVCVEGAFQVRNHLGVRNTLREHPELRDEYGAVKLALAANRTNIVDYIEAKGEVIQKVLKAAGLLTDEELAAIRVANEKGERRGALKTERLTLREFIIADVPAYHALESIPEVVRYQTWGPKTNDQAAKDVVTIIQNSTVKPREHFELAVDCEEKFVGRVGAKIKMKDEEGKAVEPPHVDLWFSFLPEVHGKGLATEAMKAFVPTLGSPLRLEIECDPRNTGSCKMAERLGFTKISLTERVYECKGEWVDSLVYQKSV